MVANRQLGGSGSRSYTDVDDDDDSAEQDVFIVLFPVEIIRQVEATLALWASHLALVDLEQWIPTASVRRELDVIMMSESNGIRGQRDRKRIATD